MSPRAATVGTALAVVWFALAQPPAALAASGGARTFLGLPHWVWLSANLLLFLGIAFRLVGPPLMRFLDARAEEIRQSLRLAATQQEEAKALRAGVGERITALEREVTELTARAEREGEREHAELVAQAERERERMLLQAREEIALRVAQARQQLTTHTAELAARLAGERLANELGSDERQRVFERNLVGLERAAGEKGTR